MAYFKHAAINFSTTNHKNTGADFMGFSTSVSPYLNSVFSNLQRRTKKVKDLKKTANSEKKKKNLEDSTPQELF